MTRLLSFCLVLCLGVILNLALEVKAVRADQDEMGKTYAAFLARKVKGGGTIGDSLIPGSVSIVKTGAGMVACGVMPR